jgi:DNA-directed RNA polymerase specialized sigma24 family protein
VAVVPRPALGELLVRCRGQEEAAWGEFRTWFRRVAAHVLGRFPNLSPLEREEAEDEARVTVALEISGNRITGTTDGAIASFVRAVVTNAARDVWRRRRPGEPLPPLLRDEDPSPAERAMFQAQLECAETVIRSWSPDNRFIFMMKIERVTAATIKADLERLFGLFLSIETIDVRFFRLRREVRRRCPDLAHE